MAFLPIWKPFMPAAYFARGGTLPEDELERGLSKYCAIPPQDPKLNKVTPISDAAFNHIRMLLKNFASPVISKEWKNRPRIYTVLRLIDRLDVMSQFIEGDFYDAMLPMSANWLPDFLGGSKTKFLHYQQYCLTDAKQLELGKKGKHVHFSGSGDQHFVVMRSLGSGGFGHVDHVWSKLSLQEYARKRSHRGYDRGDSRQQYKWFEREISALKRLSHRHLVQIKGTYTDPECFAFLMEPVADCNLEIWLQTMRIEYKPNLRQYFGCLAGAVTYLHSQRVYHMDIKLLNILVKGQQIFLTDFGAAHDWSKREQSTTWGSRPRTYFYMPPELKGDPNAPQNYATDIWSLGVVFLEMVTVLRNSKLKAFQEHLRTKENKRPYVYDNPVATTSWLEILRKRDGPDYDNVPLSWIKDMLAHAPLYRPSAGQLRGQILQAGHFSGFCCSSFDHIWEDTPHLNNQTDQQDTEISVYPESDDYVEEVAVRGEYLDAGRTSTIQMWIDRTDIPEVAPQRRPRTVDDIVFDIEDDSSAASEAESALDFSGAIPERLANFDFLGGSGHGSSNFQTENTQNSEEELVFDVEVDRSSSDTSTNSVQFSLDVESPVLETISEEIGEDALEALVKFDTRVVKPDTDDDVEEACWQEDDKVDVEDNASHVVEVPCTKELDRNIGGADDSIIHFMASHPPSQQVEPAVSATEAKYAPVKFDSAAVVSGLQQVGAHDIAEGLGGADTDRNVQHRVLSRRNTARLTQENLKKVDVKVKKHEKSWFKSRLSAKRYMQQVNRAETEAATSVMSDRTGKKIQGLSLTIWASQSIPLLSEYAARGKTSAVKALLENGANPGTKARPNKGPLFRAVKGASLKHNKCVDLLLRFGANANVKSSRTGQTPLLVAIEHQPFPGYRGLIWTLLQHGADPNIRDRNGDYPLLQILYGGYEPLQEHRRDALALILTTEKHPANVNITPPGTLNMPLHLAVRRQDPWAVGMLLEKGADVEARNGAGQSPFALAVIGWSTGMSDDRKEIAAALLKYHANANEPLAPTANRALHTAISCRLLDVVGMLMQYKANPHLKNTHGKNAFDVCNQMLSEKKIDQETAEAINSTLNRGKLDTYSEEESDGDHN